ncbi:MAG: glycosyltransferase, partial [Acidobacteriota bacterium]
MLRIALYTHDTLGLGHTQRVAKLARGLTQAFSDARCLLLTGLEKPGLIPPSKMIDFIRVPGVAKTGVEKYRSRRLGIPLSMLTSIRSTVLGGAVESFRPDVFIVDNVPLGMNNELLPLLERFKANARPVKAVLLLRDVLDSPRHIKSIWARRGDYDALRRLYDLILVFSRPEIFDPVKAYDFPAAAARKTRFCGFLGALSCRPSSPCDPKSFPRAGTPMVTVTVGGGEDGFSLIWTYLKGIVNCPELKDTQHFILLGPFIPEAKRNRIVASFGDVPNLFIHYHVFDFENWIRASDLIVAMGGYNPVYEVLSLRKRLLVVPRVFPRREQLIRAKALAGRGLIEMIHPDHLTPELICQKVRRMLATPWRRSLTPGLEFDGVRNAVCYLRELLRERPFDGAEAI